MPSVGIKIPTLEEVWQHVKSAPWIGECPADDGRHAWIYEAAKGCAAHWLPITPEQAEDLIRRDLTRPEQHPNEIRHSVANAYRRDYCGGNGSAEPRAEVEPFKPELMAESAAKVPFEVTPDWLAEVSPECVLDVTPSQYLDAVFRPEENVAVKVDKLDRGLVYQVGDYESAARLNRYVKTNTAGAWYCTNPVDGQYNLKPDGNRGGCYGDRRITDWRYLLLESDHEGFEQHWLNIVVQLNNVVALYTSGNVSVHALVRVSATSKDEFNRIADQYKRLAQVGACERSLSATRATRLPGVVRADNGREQRLLYLNPNADGQPIYEAKTL
jgi:hypothetical protein